MTLTPFLGTRARRHTYGRTRALRTSSGKAKRCTKLLEQVAIGAPTDSTVLLHGETGTCKELIARAIHVRFDFADHGSLFLDEIAGVVSCGFLECLLGRLRPDCEYDSPVDLPSLEALENVVDGFERLRLDDCLHFAFSGKAQSLFDGIEEVGRLDDEDAGGLIGDGSFNVHVEPDIDTDLPRLHYIWEFLSGRFSA